MRHISAISRMPVVADEEVDNILQTIIEMVSFLFDLLGAFETAFTTIANAVLALKGESQ